ncbi:MAG TPA: hypothetical protein VLZ78_11320 [Terrimesophilobacter sp.]|nr:hypothetical protein [Terrimesophilobacter sp.]
MSTVNSTHAATSTGWAGWARFAAVILIVSGIFSAVQGLVALIGPNSYYVVANGDLFLFDVAGWGWWNLIIGVALLLTGLALFTGAMWARVVAVVLAVLSAVVQLLLVPAQPWWSFIVIAMDVLIIYAVIAHGNELSTETD